jgi:hypothetical protein
MFAKYVFLLIFAVSVLVEANGQNFHREKISRDNYYQVGIGPSIMYADNAGSIRNLDNQIRPSFSVAGGKKIRPFLDIRGTLGYQYYQSQSREYFGNSVLEIWGILDKAVETQSNVVFVDVMPIIHLIPFHNHALRRKIDLYGGMGLGYVAAINQEYRLKDENLFRENKVRTSMYIPLRGGISYKLGLYSDISLEGSLLLTFSDLMVGNDGHNRYNDHYLQGQVVYRRYLDPLRNVY